MGLTLLRGSAAGRTRFTALLSCGTGSVTFGWGIRPMSAGMEAMLLTGTADPPASTATLPAGAREKMLNTLRQLTGHSSRKPAADQSQ